MKYGQFIKALKDKGVKVEDPEFDSYFWAKARPALSLSPKIFTVNVA